MKKVTLLLLLAILIASCSSSKITSSQWMSDDFKNLNIDRILVFASTEDVELQREFEERTSAELRAKGMTPVKMHDEFPDIHYKEAHTQEEINEFIADCKVLNIDKILFASRKSMTVDTVRAKSIHNYMNTLEPLKLGDKDEENLAYDTKEITTYIVEAAVYDIAVSKEDKPIATATVKATNPKSLDLLKERFLKAVVKLFDSN